MVSGSTSSRPPSSSGRETPVSVATPHPPVQGTGVARPPGAAPVTSGGEKPPSIHGPGHVIAVPWLSGAPAARETGLSGVISAAVRAPARGRFWEDGHVDDVRRTLSRERRFAARAVRHPRVIATRAKRIVS